MPVDYYKNRKEAGCILIAEYSKIFDILVTGLNFAYFLIFNTLHLYYNDQGYK